MTTNPHIPDPRHPRVHDRGRGPELIGTRVTVYAVDDRVRYMTDEAEIAESLGISVDDLSALTAYIADHAEAVRAVTLRLDERDRANAGPPRPVAEVRRRLERRAAERLSTDAAAAR